MISEEQIWDILNQQTCHLTPAEEHIWDAVKILPELWNCLSWNDGKEQFWAVGLIGTQVIWFNHNEDGFNISRYKTVGNIQEYWCNEDEISHISNQVIDLLNGLSLSKCGPPQPLE